MKNTMANPKALPDLTASSHAPATKPRLGNFDESNGLPNAVLTFNANDPTGTGGLAGDALAISSVGAHALTVVTGAYLRDTVEIVNHVGFDEEAIADQAETILSDATCAVIKAGFVGGADGLRVVAEVASDFSDLPLVAYMPDLSWWDEANIDLYHQAFEELLMPETTVLVGNYNTLNRWLLPDWASVRPPSARDIAVAAAQRGAAFVLVTGLSSVAGKVDNTLASAEAALLTVQFERVDASFLAAGDTLSAALAGLLASGMDLVTACGEALNYMDACLCSAYPVGMGKVAPDRLFWAAMDDDLDPHETTESTENLLSLPDHETRH